MAKRDEQIERVMSATVGMYGDLQGIAGKSIQEIEDWNWENWNRNSNGNSSQGGLANDNSNQAVHYPSKQTAQLLKIREMRNVLEFDLVKGASGDETLKPLQAVPGFEKDAYSAPNLRKEIEPWLTSLFQSEHLSLLAGTGLTTAIHYRVTGRHRNGFQTGRMQFLTNRSGRSKAICQRDWRGEPNPEDSCVAH